MGLKLLIIAVAIFLSTFNLHATQSFVGDSARDTVRMMEIWQKKEVTLLGPPLSLGYGSAKEVYFGSLSLYIGLAGILIAGLDPVGAVIPNILVFIISIPIFLAWAKKFTSEKSALLATVIYSWNPLTINYMRFFWNPNLIIPLSVIFWYLVSSSSFFWAGLVLGIMFNLHYLGILGGVLYGLYLLIKHSWSNLIKFILGFGVGILPILIFEIRNNFYLLKTLWWNISAGEKIWSLIEKPSLILGIANPFITPLGLIHSEMSYPVMFDLPLVLLTILSLAILILVLKHISRQYQSSTGFRPYLLIVIASIVLINVSDAAGHTRYVWSVLPIIILLLAETIISFKNMIAILAVIVFILGNTLINISSPRMDLDEGMPLKHLESISNTIQKDNPPASYNVTETITGDARFVALRYFLLRDVTVKPQSEEGYTNLDRLYIVTRAGVIPLLSDRWEFSATPNLAPTHTFNLGEIDVIKYERR